MKRGDRAVTFFANLLLLLTAAYGTVYLFANAFSLESTNLLPLYIAAFGLLFMCVLSFKKLFAIPALLVVLALAFFTAYYHHREFTDCIETVFYQLSLKYSSVYPHAYHVQPKPEVLADCTYLLAALAFVLEAALALALRRERATWLAAALPVPAAAFCVTVISYPSRPAILALTIFWLLCALTAAVRRGNPAAAARLTLTLLPAALVCVGGLALLITPENYLRSDGLKELAYKWESKFVEMRNESTFDILSGTRNTGNPAIEGVDLAGVGPKRASSATAFRLRADEGEYYLRAASVGDYTGATWEPADEKAFENEYISAINDLDSYSYVSQYHGLPPLVWGAYPELPDEQRQMDVSLAKGGMELTLLPYYSKYSSELTYHDSYAEFAYQDSNAEFAVSEYSLTYQTVAALDFRVVSSIFGGATPIGEGSIYYNYVNSHYLSLPDGLRGELEGLLYEAGIPTDESALTEDVVEFVRNSARYDLATPRFPRDEDFVVHFLTESETGYCVHFASALTCLLRALGIPARYTVGYLVSVSESEAGQWKTVTENSAHAWTEVYLPGIGWTPFDATPPDEPDSVDEPSAVEETPSEPTSPDEPEPPDEPETPTETPENTNAPAAEGGVEGAASLAWLKWLLLLPALALAGLLNRHIHARRRRLAASGNENRAVIFYWKYARRVGKFYHKTDLPEKLTPLAERAYFSGERLTREDARTARTLAEAAAAEKYAALPPILKPVFRYVCGLD